MIVETGATRPVGTRRVVDRGPRLPYLPGLDGLRAVSVIAVLLYHYRDDRSFLRGGFLGVEVFFVISGYLITSLLLAEARTTYRVDLRHFWARRIRRLWPALLAMMLLTGLLVAVFYHEDLGRLKGDLGFGFYAENWWHIFHGVSYVDLAADVGKRQPFQHLWSLAVEEQFYVVWPLLFIFGRWFGLSRLRAFTIALCICSWMLMVWFALHSNLNHAYLSTETRAYGPLSGALLAFAYPPRHRTVAAGARARTILDSAGAAALIGLFILFVFARQTSTWLYVIGFPLTDLFAVVLITVIVSPTATVGRMLGSRPLQWVGLRSYGIYLWGIAIFEFTRPHLDLDVAAPVVLFLRIVLVLFVVELSYRGLERPVRSGAFAAAWRELRDATGERRLLLMRRWRVGAAIIAVTTLFVGAAAMAAPTPNNLQITGGKTSVGGGDCVLTGKCAIPTAPPTTAKGWKVSAVGDSVMLGAATKLEYTLTGPMGGGVLVNAAVSRHAGTCLQVLQLFAAQRVLAPLVIVHCGNNGALGDDFVDQVMRIAGPRRHVMFVSLKVPRSWEASDNAQLAEGVSHYKNARILDWHNLGDLLNPQNAYFYRDGYHLRPPGRTFYANAVLRALQLWHWL
jgi:peptidoglycan/LPS O-acetylase OafA/YrhL